MFFFPVHLPQCSTTIHHMRTFTHTRSIYSPSYTSQCRRCHFLYETTDHFNLAILYIRVCSKSIKQPMWTTKFSNLLFICHLTYREINTQRRFYVILHVNNMRPYNRLKIKFQKFNYTRFTTYYNSNFIYWLFFLLHLDLAFFFSNFQIDLEHNFHARKKEKRNIYYSHRNWATC